MRCPDCGGRMLNYPCPHCNNYNDLEDFEDETD